MKVKALAKVVGTKIWENRSNIEFGVGLLATGVGTGMIMSKAEDAVEVKHDIERQVKEIQLRDENDDWDSSNERTKACLKVAADAGKGYAKCYGPGVAVEVSGLVLMGISHATDRKELAVTSAALASTAMEFAQYRQRVKEELGEAKEEELYLGKDAEVVNEDGTTSINEEALPMFALPFTKDNPHWSDDMGINFDFWENLQRWMNIKLQKEGVVFWNDIRRASGNKVDPKADGWGITAVDDDGNTNYIDLGIYRDTGRAAAFRDGKPTEMIFVVSGMEPNISSKLYRLMKYHRDWDCELQG